MFEDVERRVLRSIARIVLTVAAIAVLAWSVCVPSFSGGCRLNANESAAIATLKNIRHAQLEVRSRLAIDRDGDGVGEFGWFGELAGSMPLRVPGPAHLLDPPVLSSAFGRVDFGRVRRSGYLFQMWLPAAGGAWIHEVADVAVDPAGAAANFMVYAWPSAGSTGRRAFFIDATGDVLASANEIGYRGVERPVSVDAALLSSDAAAECSDATRTGRDGGVWVTVQ